MQTAFIPSRDLFTLYSLSGGGYSCRTYVIDVIKFSLGYSEEGLSRSREGESYTIIEAQVLQS